MHASMPQEREAALDTLVELMGHGYAGLDQYDDSRFVVHCPEPFLTQGEKAIDDLSGYMLQVGPIGARPDHVAAILPTRAWLDLGLDSRDAPRLVVPLASRRAVA